VSKNEGLISDIRALLDGIGDDLVGLGYPFGLGGYNCVDSGKNECEKSQHKSGNRIRPIPPELAVLVSIFVAGSILIFGDLAGIYLIGERRFLLGGLLVLLGNGLMLWVMLTWIFGQPLAWPFWWYL